MKDDSSKNKVVEAIQTAAIASVAVGRGVLVGGVTLVGSAVLIAAAITGGTAVLAPTVGTTLAPVFTLGTLGLALCRNPKK